MNIILISVDCLRADHVGYTKDAKFKMPNLHNLALRGISYTNCIVPAPFTTTSHASMLTGLYPHEHGIRHLNGERLSPSALMIQHNLKSQNYATHAVVSCFHMTHIGIEEGFDIFEYSPSALGDKLGRGNYNSATTVTDRAIKSLAFSTSARNFLFLHYFDAHVHVGTQYESNYLDELSIIDCQIGRLVDYCKMSNRETLFVITGDHGKKIYEGEHNFPCLNPRNPRYDPLPCQYDDEGSGGHGAELYDECVRVPLILYRTSNNQLLLNCKKQVSSTQIPNMILDEISNTYRTYQEPMVYLETFSPDQLFKQGIPLLGMRSDKWKLIFYQIDIQDGRRIFRPAELYNLIEDPKEVRNVIEDYPDIVAIWQRRLGKFITKAPAQNAIEDAQIRKRLKDLGYI